MQTARPARGVALRELHAMAELRHLEHLQREVWGVDDLEIVPATVMSAAVHAGGLVSVAVHDDEIVGFTFAFVATPHGRGMTGTGLHSHMAAVIPSHQSRGIGRALKYHQAEWARKNGLEWISWTFDPLLRRNARFNFVVLGAKAYDYLVDVYGPMPGRLGGGIASDRLLAVWKTVDALAGADLAAEREPAAGPGDGGVEMGSQGWAPLADQLTGERGSDAWLLQPSEAGTPPTGVSRDLPAADLLFVATPEPEPAVFENVVVAEAWRRAHRETLKRALDEGYVAADFERGAYVLRRPTKAETQHL